VGGKFERSERLEHQTLGAQKLAVRSEDYWEYKPEQRVQTIDGVTGVVKHVEDGPFPGSEEYHVVLEHGMGGGQYTASQLSPAPITAEAMEQTAAVDYPELSQILVERPDPARQFVTAAKGDNPFANEDDSDDSDDKPDPDDSKSDDDSDGDDSEDSSDDSSGKDGDKDSDDGDDAPPWAKKAVSLFSDLVVTAATDADFRFHITAAWRDVVAKAKRIRTEGRLRVTLASDGYVFGEVKGDHHVYETGLQRMPGKVAAHSWSCGCKWGAYHWGADDDFSRFAGRMCSHALALQYEAQSRGMFGRDVHVDEHKPTWVPRHVVVRYDIDADSNRLAPSTAAYDQHGDYFDSGYSEHEEADRSKHWDDIHEGLEGVHRGIGIHLQPDDHAIVHDEDRPLHERAKHLLESIPRSHEGQRHGDNVGWHWSSEEGVGEDFADAPSHPKAQTSVTGVVFHGHKPDRSDINEYPDETAGHVYDYHDHGEREVPLHHGAHVGLKGISWKDLGREEDHPALGHPHPSGTPSMFFPYLGDFTHHTFGEHEHQHVVALRRGYAPLSVVARAAVAAGENQEELLLALSAAGIRQLANADSPFGDPAGTSYVQPKTPGATAPRKAWENPASAGPLAGADPAGWNRQLPLQSYAAHGGLEAALFEPGAEATLNDEPEGALPSTDGAVPTDEASDLAPSMTAGLKRQALKDFTLAEQQALINEGEGVRAANLDRLDIKGTHYADLESVLAAQEDDTTWLA
jgi:hypothetical protein